MEKTLINQIEFTKYYKARIWVKQEKKNPHPEYAGCTFKLIKGGQTKDSFTLQIWREKENG